MGGVLERLTKI